MGNFSTLPSGASRGCITGVAVARFSAGKAGGVQEGRGAPPGTGRFRSPVGVVPPGVSPGVVMVPVAGVL